MTASSLVLRRFGGLSVTDLARVVATKSFQYAPRVVKYFAYVLLLLHFRSWPFAWHYILFKPLFVLRGRYYLHRLRYAFSPPHVRMQKNLEWMEGLSKVGMNPFDLQVTYSTFAGFDDIDYNLHLSNSSYPKRLDAARLKAAIELCPTLYRVGGWMGLGATHFTFLREIPMLSTYELRVTIMSWDNKWMYCVCKFVTKPRKGRKIATRRSPSPPSIDGLPHVSVRTDNGVFTPLPGSGTSSPPNGHVNPTAANPTAAALARQLIERPEPDGAVINCLAISELVCKIGRLTIPPALVLAVEGFSCLPPDGSGSRPYSLKNPPPHWDLVRRMRGDAFGKLDAPAKGSMQMLRNFFTTDWRHVPEGERWWEEALGGEVEERRLRGLGCMQALRKGVDEARGI